MCLLSQFDSYQRLPLLLPAGVQECIPNGFLTLFQYGARIGNFMVPEVEQQLTEDLTHQLSVIFSGPAKLDYVNSAARHSSNMRSSTSWHSFGYVIFSSLTDCGYAIFSGPTQFKRVAFSGLAQLGCVVSSGPTQKNLGAWFQQPETSRVLNIQRLNKNRMRNLQ